MKITPPSPAFLAANWQNILILSWPIDAGLLLPHLPPGLAIDRFDGVAYISIVGLSVANSRIAGIPAGPRRYPQVNCRFYVRRTLPAGGHRPGVVFIRQLVPYRTIARAARLIYREPFQYAPMPDAGSTSVSDQQRRIAYQWRCNGQTAGFGAEIPPKPAQYAALGSLAEFLTARYWGYNGASDGGRLREYQVRREPWQLQTATACGFEGNLNILSATDPIAAAMSNPPASAIIAAGGPTQIGWPHRCA